MQLIRQESKIADRSPASDARSGSMGDQVTVRQSSNNTVLVVSTFLGVALSAVVLGLLLLATFGRPSVSRSSENASSFCCPDEARAVLRGLNASVDPCEDFYGYVCSMADDGTTVRLSPTIRVAVMRRRLELAAVGAGTTAAGRMLASIKKHFLEKEESLQEDIADFAAAILATGLANERMNLSRMVRFFAQLSFRYALPGVLSFSVPKVGTALLIERNDHCFLDDDNSFVEPAVYNVNGALKASVTVDQLAQLERHLPVRQRVDASRTRSQALDVSPFSALSQGDWAAIVDDVIRSVYPNLTETTTRGEERLDDVLSFLADASRQPTTIAYAIVCTAVTSLEKIDDGAIGLREHPKHISCKALGIGEIEDRIVMDAVHSGGMDDYIRATFTKTRTNVMHRAKGHPMFYGTPGQELVGELERLKLMLPEDIIASDIPVPDLSETFAHNLFAARSYAFDVRKARVARNIPSADELLLSSLVRNGHVIYVPTNMYALLHHKVHNTVALDATALAMEIANQMWSFLLERPWSPKTRENIELRLECFAERYLNGSKSQATATNALAVVSAIDASMTARSNIIGIVDGTKMSTGRLAYITWVYDRCASFPETTSHLDVNVVLRNSPAFVKTFECPASSYMAQRICCIESC
ncbi:hypothetical protein HPB52_002193 [Rhipicephalus sanguineus]|uniref:Uncharacterized protein n=1 Tax=Rhipicephalus sanguineus TaxID=34632 RepID=A0A9D4SPY1_RHISA|nr:hypothetical protein HPB52_002193 [Rhipicephalus sanguineus]